MAVSFGLYYGGEHEKAESDREMAGVQITNGTLSIAASLIPIWLLFGGLLASHRHDWLPIILLGERITRWFVAAAQDPPHQAIRMANMAQDVVEDFQQS